jgi:O-Antigen ligase/Tetratricopeptide repeat
VSEVTQVVARVQTPAERLLALVRDYGLTIAVAAAVFVVAYDNGGFGESTRDSFAILLWWAAILGLGLAIWPLARITRGALVTGTFLAAFGLFTLISAAWASDAAAAYAEFTRVALYLAVFATAVLAGRRDNAGRWIDGLSLGIVGVAVIALVSRFFPGTFAQEAIVQFLPGDAKRLGFPVGYYNGLAILVALALPLLLRQAVGGRNAFLRGLALVPVPAIAVIIDLSSSRGGAVTALVGCLAFLWFTARRWAVLGALLAAAVGSVAAVLAVIQRDALVNGPFDTSLAESQGRSAALIVGGVCILTGLVYGVACRALAGRDLRLSRGFGWALVGVAAVVVIAGILVSHPIRRFDDFKRPPGKQTHQIQGHLLSSSGSGRWQLWGQAVREFESRPLIGRGAGSYGQWWAQHRTISLASQDAHSLYLETLGELGLVGFALLAGAFVAGFVSAGRRLLRSEGDARVTLAAVTAAFTAYAVAAGIDWMWELTIVSVVGFACLALAVGPATAPGVRPRLAEPGDRPARRYGRFGLIVGAIVGGWLLICAIAVPLLSGLQISASQDAAARGDLAAASSDAADARSIQPWSPTPYLQLALIEEQAGNLTAAHAWIRKAIDHDPDDWALWLTAARIETEQGAVAAARRSLARARELNPRYLG